MNRLMIGPAILVLWSLCGGCSGNIESLEMEHTPSGVTQPPKKVAHHTLTLITGDRLEVTKTSDGRWTVVVDQAARPTGPVAFSRVSHPQKGLHLIPADVKHLVPGVVDARFFNIDYLIDNKMDDAHQRFVSAIITTDDSTTMQRSAIGKALNYRRLATGGLATISVDKKQLHSRTDPLWQQTGRKPTITLAGISKFRPNRVFKALLDQALPAVGADVAHQEFGLRGDGINVAVLDTGVDDAHPDFFFEDGTSKLVVNEDLTCFTTTDPEQCDGTPVDTYGHGTFVASIAVGTGAAKEGLYQGMAPGARLMNVKVINRYGWALESDVMQGILVATLGTNDIRGDEPAIEADVISMSLGGWVTPGEEDPLVELVNQMVTEHGVVIVAAAGNDGGYYSINSPAIAEQAIAVGASNKSEPFYVSGFSSGGPTAGDFHLKPDLVAPGVDIIAACASSVPDLGCDPLDPYFAESGTSASTPVVSGGVALMIQQAREDGLLLTPQLAKDRLLSSSETIIAYWDPEYKISVYEQGAGLMKIDQALSTEFVFSPANVSIGLVTWEVEHVERTVTLRNHTEQTRTLDLSIELRSEEASFDHAISLSSPQVTLAPGEIAEVTIGIDMTLLPSPKMQQVFEGELKAFDGERLVARGILGLTKQARLYPLIVDTIGPDGAADPDMTDVYVYDALDLQGFISDPWTDHPDHNGRLHLRVPAGTYNIMMKMWKLDGPKFSLYRVSHLEHLVGAGSSGVTLDARQARPVLLEIEADPLATETRYFHSYMEYTWPNQIGSYPFGISGVHELYTFSNKKPTVGQFGVINNWIRGHDPLEQSPVIYNIAEAREQDDPYVLRITETDLQQAGVRDHHFHFEKPGQGYVGNFMCPTDWTLFPSACGLVLTFLNPLDRPLVQREFYTPQIATFGLAYEPEPWEVVFEDGEYSLINGWLLPGKVWQPGEHQTAHWGERPVKPAFNEVIRDGDELSVDGQCFVDPKGHPGWPMLDWPDWFSLTAFVNGEQVAFTDWYFSTYFELPPSPSVVGLTVNSKSSPSSTDSPVETSTTVTLISSNEDQGEISIPNTTYQVENLNLVNRVKCEAGDSCHLRFSVQIEPSTTDDRPLSFIGWLWLSTDGGETWSSPDKLRKTNTSFEVWSEVPLTDQNQTSVSVKLFALTSDGVLLTETVQRAFLLEPLDGSF